MRAMSDKSQAKVVTDVMVARQSIYNSQMGVYAYELLFRSSYENLYEIGEDKATAQVVLNAFSTMGLENLVGSRYAAINISERYIHQAQYLPVPQERVILDIPTSLSVNKALLISIKQLKSLGFTIAIDSFVYRKELNPLLPLVDILKMDVHGVDEKKLPKYVKQLRKFKNLSLLSLKVESLQEFSFYRDMGFDYCQGYLLSKPRVYKAKNLSSSKLVVMSLLSALYKSTINFNEVEQVISRDVSISYKLLKLINSAFFSLPSEVDSIHRAVVLLGKDQLRSWVSMLALSSMEDCPESLLEIAVIRAKMCELLAKCADLPNSDSYFTVGLFSALDVLMKQPLKSLLVSLPLHDDIKDAILQQQGLMGEALRCVVAYEASDWQNVSFQNVPGSQISKASYTAFVWSIGLIRKI